MDMAVPIQLHRRSCRQPARQALAASTQKRCGRLVLFRETRPADWNILPPENQMAFPADRNVGLNIILRNFQECVNCTEEPKNSR